MGNPPTIDYGRPDPVKKTSPIAWLVLLAVVALGLVSMVALCSFGRPRETANRVKCASNLH